LASYVSSEKFKGRTYVLTGCSKGIGYHVALMLMERGAVVHGVARTKEALKRLRERFSNKFTYTACDLTDDECVDRVVKDVRELYGGPYGLINNAGAGALGNPLELGPKVFDRLVKLLYLAPVKLTLKLVPWMIKRKEGVVVNLITLGIATHIKGLEAYLAPKHALHRFSKDLRDYLRPKGVSVITVYPPATRTDFFKGQGLQEFYHKIISNPFIRWSTASPEKIAEEIINAIKVGKEVVVVPRIARVLLVGK